MDTRYVYFAYKPPARGKPVSYIKIGISKDPESRLKQLGLGMFFAIECEWDFAAVLGRALHKQLAASRVWIVRTKGTWPWNPEQRVIQ